MKFEKYTDWYKIFESMADIESQVPLGRATSIIKGGKKMCIAHSNEGFFAVNDKCPHNGASLGNGFCSEEGSVVCPVHRYHFDLKTGRAKSGGGDFVQTYPIEVREDGVFIGFEETVWNLF